MAHRGAQKSSGKKHEMNHPVSESSERTIMCQGVGPLLHEKIAFEMFFGRDGHTALSFPVSVKHELAQLATLWY
jgi:hypothetical protein